MKTLGWEEDVWRVGKFGSKRRRLELEKFWDAFCTFERNLWDEWGCKEGQEIWIQEEKQGWS